MVSIIYSQTILTNTITLKYTHGTHTCLSGHNEPRSRKLEIPIQSEFNSEASSCLSGKQPALSTTKIILKGMCIQTKCVFDRFWA